MSVAQYINYKNKSKMSATTATPSGLTLKGTKVNQYTKNGALVYVYTLTGDKSAIEQYEADQNVNTEKGCQYHEVTKLPLAWSPDLGDTFVRGRDGQWRISNDVVRATTQNIKQLTRQGNDIIADKLADRLADEMFNNIKQMMKKRGAPSVSEPKTEDKSEETPTDNLNGV